YWTYEEDAALIIYLHELSGDPKWKSENGFKNGYMNKLEQLIKSVFPNCGLNATPHIELRIKHWSEKYSAMAKMLSISGFGRDVEKKMLQVEKVVFDEWVKTHKKAKGLFGGPFNHIDTLAEIYTKDKATGDASESFMATYSSTSQSGKRPMKLEDHSTPSKMAKLKARSSTNDSSTQSCSIKIEDNHPTHSKKEKVKDVKEAKVKGMNLKSLYKNDDDDVWSKEKEREQWMDEKVNKVLEEVMKLDGISPFKALEVAIILMAEEHKLRIFYQAPTNTKKQ
ncbi:Neuron navigator 3, partial [Bienertia sinuspersici]